MYGSGHQTRSFCYVADHREFRALLRMDEQVTGPINLGNPRRAMAMINLAELVDAGLVGSSSPIKKAALPEDPRQRRPDITKARNFLDWRPRIEIEEGCYHTKYFEDTCLRDLWI